jgi:hypothetical protein
VSTNIFVIAPSRRGNNHFLDEEFIFSRSKIFSKSTAGRAERAREIN